MAAIRKSLPLFRSLTSLSTRTLASTTTTTATPHRAPTAPPAVPTMDRGLGTVRDVLKTKGEKFYHTAADAPVMAAAKRMVQHNIGSLLIVEGARNRAVGIVTETDYLNKVLGAARPPEDMRVRDIMSTKTFTYVSPAATLHDCMELMTERKIRHIPVISDGRVLGMVSIGDIVSELVAAHKRNAEHLHSFISGSY